jgi:hypothetical protein
MANLKISELPYLATIDDNMEFAVVNNQSTPETQKVTITGMTFQGGSTAYDSLNGIADPATPLLILGDGVEFLFTADTFNIKRFEANTLVSVMVTYKTSGGSIGDLSYFRPDVGGNTGPQIYLPDTAEAWNSVSVTCRSSNLSAGSQTFDLYMNLTNGVNFEFAQVFISAFER